MSTRILSIETSCDETALALVEASGGLKAPRFKVVHHVVSSQIAIHRPFGGVVPNLAKREHIKNLPILYKKLNPKPSTLNPDLIAVTVGPGLEPALWAGIEFAKSLSKELGVPLIGANHMEGHLYSFLLEQKRVGTREQVLGTRALRFPAVALVVSGGHTILLAMQSLTKWKKLGETRDDAAGEAFDKVARMLDLPYPGGPEIAKLAMQGDCDAIEFPQPMKYHKNYDFSFSGVKTSVLYYLRDNPKANKADVAASFEKAVTDVLAYKTERAVREFGAQSVILCGGVAANQWLRKKLMVVAKKEHATFFCPPMQYNTDNAAMIAPAAYLRILKKKKYPLTANANLTL